MSFHWDHLAVFGRPEGEHISGRMAELNHNFAIFLVGICNVTNKSIWSLEPLYGVPVSWSSDGLCTEAATYQDYIH